MLAASATRDELATALVDAYGIDATTAAADTDAFLDALSKQDCWRREAATRSGHAEGGMVGAECAPDDARGAGPRRGEGHRSARSPACPFRPRAGWTRRAAQEAPTCLERALVRQRWLAAHGDHRAIAIGVTAPSREFAAHAWLVGEEDPVASAFLELTRLEP